MSGFSSINTQKLRIFELYYNFLTEFHEVNKFEELQTDTDSLYLAIAVKQPEDFIRPEMKAEWERLRLKDCTDSFTAETVSKPSPEVLGQARQEKAWTLQRRIQMYRAAMFIDYVAKFTTAMMLQQRNLISKVAVCTKCVLEQSDDALSEAGRVQDKSKYITSTNRSFRTSNHAVATENKNGFLCSQAEI